MTDTPQQDDVAQRIAQLSGLGTRLQSEVDRRVADRRSVEDRMLEDARQYAGQYDPELLASIRKAEGSEAFANVTRDKCNLLESRIADALLPIDGDNWSIQPTPIPEIAGREDDATPIGTTPQGAEVQARDMAKGLREVADERAESMARLMRDQLGEAGYNAAQREVIHDAVVLGTGILKGPFPTIRQRERFQRVSDGQQTVYQMQVEQAVVPGFTRVDPFDFFPDLSAPDIDSAESVFQRHYLTRRQLRELARDPSFLVEQIATLLLRDADGSGNAGSSAPQHLTSLREIAGLDAVRDGRYQLWEYHGPVKRAELEAADVQAGEKDDPLAEMMACIWFVDGVVIKAALSPIDNGKLPYQVFALDRDGTGIFGTGVPRRMRNSQRVINAAYRALLDNAAFATRPQLVIDSAVVVPVDGSYALTPGKTWTWDSRMVGQGVGNPFQAIPITSNLSDLQSLFVLAMQTADKESGVFDVQGEHSSTLSETATGAAMQQNSMLVSTGHHVKYYDDHVTKPLIRALYAWNMLHSDDDSIKGDYEVIAKGSAALIERERASQSIVQALEMTAHPVLGPHIDEGKLAGEFFRVAGLPPVVLRGEKEAEAERERRAKAAQGGGEDIRAQIEQAKLQLAQQKLQLEQMTLQMKAQERQLQHQEFMADQQGDNARHKDQMAVRREALAVQQAGQQIKLQAQAQMDRERMSNDNARFNSEVALKLRQGSGI